MPPTPSLRHPRRLTATLPTSPLPIGGLLTAPTAAATSSAAATSAVRVNQVGYLPDGPKRATVVTTATQSLTWQLRDASGTAVASGATVPRGADTPSGQSVQVADFSSYRETGSGYVLAVDGSGSVPFDIRANLYDSLRSDAMAFFYHQRSGTPIDACLVRSAYARPAGHLGVAPDKGDTSVPCQATVCDYSQDVRGGWYGAGVSGYGGYGEKPSRNQHHRLWAHQLDASLPSPPAGSLAGGPNSALQDPVGQEKLAGCEPAACYIDDIGSHSTNEVAINWNAPLAWLAAYAAERSSTGEPTGACAVTYKRDSVWSTGFTATVTVKNTGSKSVDGWKLSWTYPAGQRVTNAWKATVTQDRTPVVARAADWNRTIEPGATANFGVQGTYEGANPSPDPSPKDFTLNGPART